MRALICLVVLLWPALAQAQSRTVLPHELALKVEVEQTDHAPLAREMVLIKITGVYRRHITRETLTQPDLAGFNWTQLGNDTWREERLNGEKVKIFTRRMAIYPDRPGTLTIGAFTHNLTLTDARDDWFDHPVTSEPVTLEVAPAPPDAEWWFPVKTLKVSDQWSNAPDQLTPGEGVLRVVRIEALGVTPEMIPPMPVLKSPSAMIFAHPDKRFVELSPEGPQSFAFWRWTIRPSNDTSTIVEPLEFEYFDTVSRETRSVTISAQRVAYGSVVPDTVQADRKRQVFPDPARLPGWPLALGAVALCIGGIVAVMADRRMTGLRALHHFALFDPLARRMRRAARHQDLGPLRRTATDIMARDGASDARRRLLAQLDHAVFDPAQKPVSLTRFARSFLRNT